MEILFNVDGKGKKAEEEADSVYVLDVDKSIYDPREPGYTQVHLLRFENERGAFKITDIDFYLEGNRHARAHSEELFN
jgi:hypothetical protein